MNKNIISLFPFLVVSTWVIAATLPGPEDFEIISQGHLYLEGPSFSAVGEFLIYVDQNTGQLLRWSEENGTVELRDYSGKINGTTFDTEGRLLLCESEQRRINRITFDGNEPLDEIIVEDLPNEPNDIVVHSNGTIWFTTPHFGGTSTDRSQQNVYRFDPETEALDVIYTSTGKPNGLAFSPDEGYLYVALYSNNQIMRIPINPDGTTAGSASEFTRQMSSGPDGLKVDEQGFVYVVISQSEDKGILVFAPDNDRVGLIRLPVDIAPPTNFCLTDRELFVTNGTSLVRVPWQGFPGAPHLIIPMRTDDLLIDGEKESAWNFAPVLPMRHPMIVWNMLNPIEFIPDPADFSGDVQVLWDADYLYLFVEVTDENPLTPYTGTWFAEDTFELYLDADRANTAADGIYDGKNDWEIGFHPVATDPVPVTLGPNSVQISTGFLAASTLTEDGYALEVAMPWTTLGLSEVPEDSHLIGIDVHAVDNDGHATMRREHKLAWYGFIDNAWQDTRIFAEAVLSERTPFDLYSELPTPWNEVIEAVDGGAWLYGSGKMPGWIFVHPENFPWAYHAEAGWMFLVPFGDGHLWAWTESAAWMELS